MRMVVDRAYSEGRDGFIIRDIIDGDINVSHDVYGVFKKENIKVVGPIKKDEKIGTSTKKYYEDDYEVIKDDGEWFFYIIEDDEAIGDFYGPFSSEKEAELEAKKTIFKHNNFISKPVRKTFSEYFYE